MSATVTLPGRAGETVLVDTTDGPTARVVADQAVHALGLNNAGLYVLQSTDDTGILGPPLAFDQVIADGSYLMIPYGPVP